MNEERLVRSLMRLSKKLFREKNRVAGILKISPVLMTAAKNLKKVCGKYSGLGTGDTSSDEAIVDYIGKELPINKDNPFKLLDDDYKGKFTIAIATKDIMKALKAINNILVKADLETRVEKQIAEEVYEVVHWS